MIALGRDTIVYAQLAWRFNAVDVSIAEKDLNGHLWVARPLVLEKLDDGDAEPQPTMRLSNAAAQQLMDQLWQCGVRPADGQGSTGANAAVLAHLHDMRAIAFGALGERVKKP